MAKKYLVCIILFSMVMHCASRLGVISYLYQQRHALAYSLGVIEERPIAVCNSDHDFGRGLAFAHHDQQESLPSAIYVAQEINLFLTFPDINFTAAFYQLSTGPFSIFEIPFYQSPHFAIFHPPALA